MARWLLLLVLSGMMVNAQAQTASASLSEDSAQFKYSMLVGGQSFGRSEMSVGFLFNNDKDYVSEIGLQVIDEAGSRARGLKIGLGGKLFGASVPNNDVMALGLGGQLRYTFPKYDRVTVAGNLYYAPSIVAFLDAERFREASASAEFAVLPQASVFLQYHQFHATLDEGGAGSIDKGARLGLRVEF